MSEDNSNKPKHLDTAIVIGVFTISSYLLGAAYLDGWLGYYNLSRADIPQSYEAILPHSFSGWIYAFLVISALLVISAALMYPTVYLLNKAADALKNIEVDLGFTLPEPLHTNTVNLYEKFNLYAAALALPVVLCIAAMSLAAYLGSRTAEQHIPEHCKVTLLQSATLKEPVYSCIIGYARDRIWYVDLKQRCSNPAYKAINTITEAGVEITRYGLVGDVMVTVCPTESK